MYIGITMCAYLNIKATSEIQFAFHIESTNVNMYLMMACKTLFTSVINTLMMNLRLLISIPQ